MIGIAALVLGIVLGLVFHPSVPEAVQPYLPIAVVAALDAVFGGLRAYLEHIFDAKVFVVSFVFNVLVAALIVWVGDQLGSALSCRRRSSSCSVSASSAMPPRYGAGFSEPDDMSRTGRTTSPQRRRRTDSPTRPPTATALSTGFGALGLVLCLLLGVAIATQVRQTESGDALDTARPADLLVLLDSLQQREAALNTEVAELQRTLASLQASGTSDQAAIDNARSRLAALSIMIGTVAATGPGLTIRIDDPARGVAPETMLDVINELRAAGAEAMEVGRATWRCASASTPGWSAGPARSRSTV